MKKLIYFIFFTTLTSVTFGQSQFHYGMYSLHQPFFNPAAAGSYENLSAAMLYKTQWTGLDGAPKIGALNIIKPFNENAISVTLTNDNIGASNSTTLNGAYAYTLKSSENSRLSMALGASLNLMQSNLSALAVNDPGDPIFASNRVFVMPNFNFGTYYFKNKFYVGLALPNLLANNITYDKQVKGKTSFDFNQLHFYLHSGYRFVINEKTNLNVSTLIKQVSGAPLQYDINAQLEINKKIAPALSYRSNKDLLLMLSYMLTEDLKLGYAYEYSFSELKNYSNGSHEIMLIYQIQPAKEPAISVPRF